MATQPSALKMPACRANAHIRIRAFVESFLSLRCAMTSMNAHDKSAIGNAVILRYPKEFPVHWDTAMLQAHASLE